MWQRAHGKRYVKGRYMWKMIGWTLRQADQSDLIRRVWRPPVVSRDAAQCLIKLSLKAVGSKKRKHFSLRETPLVLFFVPVLMWKMPSSSTSLLIFLSARLLLLGSQWLPVFLLRLLRLRGLQGLLPAFITTKRKQFRTRIRFQNWSVNSPAAVRGCFSVFFLFLFLFFPPTILLVLIRPAIFL